MREIKRNFAVIYRTWPATGICWPFFFLFWYCALYVSCTGSLYCNRFIIIQSPSYPARFDKVLILVDVTVLYIVHLGIDNILDLSYVECHRWIKEFINTYIFNLFSPFVRVLPPLGPGLSIFFRCKFLTPSSIVFPFMQTHQVRVDSISI